MFSKSKDEQFATEVPKPAKPVAKPVTQRPAAAAPSIIGSDVHIVGNVTTNGEIQLDGSVEGDVQAGAITMGDEGHLKGTISADTVIVRGEVDGAIRARTVTLERSAKVTGDVFHETLSIEAGAIIDGKFTHSEAKSSAKPAGADKEDKPAKQSAPVNGAGKPPSDSKQGEMSELKSVANA